MIRKIVISIVALLLSFSALAQSEKLYLDTSFNFDFDNTEYSGSGLGAAETLFGVTLAPVLRLEPDPGRWGSSPNNRTFVRECTTQSRIICGFRLKRDTKNPPQLAFYSCFIFPNLLVSMIFSLHTCPGFESRGEKSRDFQPKVMSSLTACLTLRDYFFGLQELEPGKEIPNLA